LAIKINEECTGASANDDRYTRALGLSQLLRDQQSKQLEQQTQRRVSLDNLAQIFPHRVRKPKSTRGTKNETNKPFISPSSTSSSDEAIKLVAAKLAHLSSGEVLARTESSAAGDKSSDFSSRGQIKAKLDGLSVHIQTKDAELSQLKQDLIDLQLLVLKEKKESEKSRSAVHRLESEVQKLESKVESLEVNTRDSLPNTTSFHAFSSLSLKLIVIF
jgi:outer membrane murein-binding lipoprotein Lpp